MRRRPAVLAVCLRASRLAVAVVRGPEILEIRRHRLRRRNRRKRIAAIVARIAVDYHVAAIVVEPSTVVNRSLRTFTVRRVRLSEAKATVTGSSRATHHALLEHLVATRPIELRRFVTTLFGGRLSRTRPWQTPTILAIVIGLSASEQPRPTEHENYSTTNPSLPCQRNHHHELQK